MRAVPQPQHPECVILGDGKCVDLIDVLGKGSLGTVYRALLESPHGLRRPVAFKLFASVASDEVDTVHDTIATAAQRTALVRHPNVVNIEDCGLWRTQPFLVSELVEGVTLAALVERYARARRRFPLDIALFIASEVAEGLSGARTARDLRGMQLGMVHLGLSTREILLSWRGEVKVEGFELQGARSATSSVRSIRALARRANVMAPEVAQGAEGDARADVFALGIVLRELLIGPRFPEGLTNSEALRLARSGHIEPVSFQPHLPEPLTQVMARAVEVDAEARYPNATALAYELRRVALALGVGDARYFLRRALDHEFGKGDEITTERLFPANDGVEEIYAVHDDDLEDDL